MRNMFNRAGNYILKGIPGLILAIALGATTVAGAQEAVPDFSEVKQAFEEGHYRMVLEIFRPRAESENASPLDRYYAGRCLLGLNREIDLAIEWLHSASRGNVPDDVTLYLARAYHRHYNFQEALRLYQKYERSAGRQEVRDQRVKESIRGCREAMEITAKYNPYSVLAVTFIDLTDSVQYSQIRMTGGSLGRKPAALRNPEEDPGKLGHLMFVPSRGGRGEFAYFSGFERNRKEGLQLYRVRRGPGGTWGDPRPLRDLNTPGDEILPYFDPIGNDLYFASDGIPGIGGFDLYRSHYDSDSDSWSEPINLGFPINSAMDEFLALPGTDLGMMMFFSNREGTDSTLTVYRVHLAEPKQETDPDDPRMLRDIASLGGAAREILAEIEALSEPVAAGSDPPDATITHPVPRSKKVTDVVILEDEPRVPRTGTAYEGQLSVALAHQSVSDSLKDLAVNARIRVRESEDPNDRWVWQKQIMVWEKRAADEQARANEIYARLDLTGKESVSVPAVNRPEALPPRNAPEGEPGTPPAATISSGSESGEVVSPILRFDILGESPYSASHPIPMDVEIPRGVFYRIQLGAFQQPVSPDAFGGISPVTGETIPSRGLFKYYAGKFSRYGDAAASLQQIRFSGYEDAFVVAWFDGTPISTQKAKQLEEIEK